jgi:hypothetical protein
MEAGTTVGGTGVHTSVSSGFVCAHAAVKTKNRTSRDREFFFIMAFFDSEANY